MNIYELVPDFISSCCVMVTLQNAKQLLDNESKNLSNQIRELEESRMKNTIDYLVQRGWYLFTFTSLDIAGADIYPYHANFIFRGDVKIPDEFANRTFSHYVESGKEKTPVVFSSKLKTSFKCENFIAFEKWIESLSEDSFSLLAEKFE